MCGSQTLEQEAVKLCRILQNARAAGSAGYLLRKAALREVSQPKRENWITVTKLNGDGRAEECFDIRHGGAEFGVCSAGFWSCFGSVFPDYDILEW